MIKIVSIRSARDPEVQKISGRGLSPSKKIEADVRRILEKVRLGGDAAVLGLARKYDGLKGPLRVSAGELRKQAEKCAGPLRTAIGASLKNVIAFHKRQRESSWVFRDKSGSRLGQTIRSLHRVGAYIPGGAGMYPSTAIMNIAPARVAGVKDIAVVTPVSGALSPALAYTLKILRVNEIYKIGGAQAVGLLAYGTKRVPRVDKIVGPGNVYAALAKKEVFGLVDIDMVAGPSEILVMADQSADPDWVAADLLSQAEHGSGYEAAVCVTDSLAMGKFIQTCLERQVEGSPKRALLKKCLSRFGRIFVVKDWNLGCDLANAIAPEHLELMVAKPGQLEKKIVNAGAVFSGPYSTEPVGDYFAGPNHVLPTNGSARFFSPLGTYDFYKRSSLIEYNRAALNKHGKMITELAETEGFIHHAAAVRKRIT